MFLALLEYYSPTAFFVLSLDSKKPSPSLSLVFSRRLDTPYANSGDISIEEFSNALSQSKMLRGIGDKLSDTQILGLKENHEMLLLAFKYLDTDRSGAIDRTEFQRGVDLLKSRMSKNGGSGGKLVEDAEELFDLMDIDGDGEIGTSTMRSPP